MGRGGVASGYVPVYLSSADVRMCKKKKAKPVYTKESSGGCGADIRIHDGYLGGELSTVMVAMEPFDHFIFELGAKTLV